VPASTIDLPLGIRVAIERDGTVVVSESTSTARLKRGPEELAGYLMLAMPFPFGAFLLTGTGAVPPADFTLEEGDLVRVSIDGLGSLENPVVVVGAAEPGASSPASRPS
jgi:2-dehydro-3-deoxy-D-arabinonate dehydratase